MDDIRRTIQESAPLLDSHIQAIGEETAYKERIRQMALSGDLLMLGRFLNRVAEGHSEAILSPLPKEDFYLERGGLIALRAFWRDFIGMAQEVENVPQPTTEMNTFAELADIGPLTGGFGSGPLHPRG